jgi:hypothetical protein
MEQLWTVLRITSKKLVRYKWEKIKYRNHLKAGGGGGDLKLCVFPDTTCISKVFNKTEISITCTTENSIRRVPNPRRSNLNLTRATQYVVYVGQMASPFTKIFQEHHDTFRTKSGLSKFADNMSDKKCSFVPIESIMNVMVRIQKAWHIDIVRNSIYKATTIRHLRS